MESARVVAQRRKKKKEGGWCWSRQRKGPESKSKPVVRNMPRTRVADDLEALAIEEGDLGGPRSGKGEGGLCRRRRRRLFGHMYVLQEREHVEKV